MTTAEQVEHFRSFGFVILRRQLDPATVGRLTAELEAAFRDALGARFDERPGRGGIGGHYLPVMSSALTPVSLGWSRTCTRSRAGFSAPRRSPGLRRRSSCSARPRGTTTRAWT